MNEIARNDGVSTEFFVEQINEIFADNFGDVILCETDDSSFKIIDDYYEEIAEWIN